MDFGSWSLCTVTLGSAEAEDYGRKLCGENSIFSQERRKWGWVEERAEGEKEGK